MSVAVELVSSNTQCPKDLSREDKDLGVASHAPPGSQASPRWEAEDSTFLSSRDTDLLELTEWTQGCRPVEEACGPALSVISAIVRVVVAVGPGVGYHHLTSAPP